MLIDSTPSSLPPSSPTPEAFDRERAAVLQWSSGSGRLLDVLGLQDALLEEVQRACQQAGDACADALGHVIQTWDPLYAAAAGAADGACETTPVWYTRLDEPPRRLAWTIPEAGDWNVVLKPEGSPALRIEASSAGVDLNEAVLSQLPHRVPIHWKCVRPGERAARVRAIFVIDPAPDSVPLDPSRVLAASESELRSLLEQVAERLMTERYDAVLSILASIPAERLTGPVGFLVHRLRAAAYRAIARHLTGAPFWFGDPEGVWAIERAQHALRQSWNVLGIDYTE